MNIAKLGCATVTRRTPVKEPITDVNLGYGFANNVVDMRPSNYHGDKVEVLCITESRGYSLIDVSTIRFFAEGLLALCDQMEDK